MADTESVSHSEQQSQRLAAEMDHWLALFDEDMALDELPLGKRPMWALTMLFQYDAIEMRAGDERLDGSDIAKHADELWFRVLYAAIEYWYRDRYGPTAMKPSGNAPLEGVVMVRGLPFALKMPANRRKVAIEGQQSWMYFEEGLGDGEVAETWIIGAPDLMKLDEGARDQVRPMPRPWRQRCASSSSGV